LLRDERKICDRGERCPVADLFRAKQSDKTARPAQNPLTMQVCRPRDKAVGLHGYYERMQGIGIGIGPALRKARLLRGKSIEEASRETRIRAEYLQALERERFDAMLGDVYVRGMLRSYSSYLGLDPTKVVTVYNQHFGGPRALLPDPTPAPIRSPRHPHLPQLVRHHPSWTFLIGVALLLLAVLGAVGLLSRTRSTPGAERRTGAEATIPVLPPTVTVVLRADQAVTAIIRRDNGRPQTFDLRPGEGRTFEANTRIIVRLDHGGTTVIRVNGHDLKKPGRKGQPFNATFTPEDFRGTPSANGP
jgi:cytoskeleton protein RodZ